MEKKNEEIPYNSTQNNTMKKYDNRKVTPYIRRRKIMNNLKNFKDTGNILAMVPPHPTLLKKIKRDFAKMKKETGKNEALGQLLRIREQSRPGMNDGLIYPGDSYPAGTPTQLIRRAAASRAPLRGTIRVIVVLVDFPDKQFDAAHTVAHFKNLFFSQTATSVRGYYADVSNSLVDIVGEVVGPYRMPKKLTEYANGQSGTGSIQPNARTMALDAVKAADPNVNFGPYDNDGDGYVDAFIVIHAGRGAEETGSSDDIWSHKWVLPGGSYNADGTKIYSYLTVPEDARIGVCCHELGHLLFGWIDLYDTDYSSEGVGNWCLMGGGSWLGNGNNPAHPCAYLKVDQGWANVIVQTTNATVQIEDVKTGRNVYRLWKNGASGNEFFLVENRQKTGFDADLPGEGLLIWHVDEAISSNSDENHPKVDLEESDGKDDLKLGVNRGDAGDPFPGSSNNTVFNSTSNPNSKSYANAETCVAVTNISAPGSTMTAQLAVICKLKEKELKQEFKDYKEHLKDVKERFKELSIDKLEKEKDKLWKEPKEIKEIYEKYDLWEKGARKEVEKPDTDKAAMYDKASAGDKLGEKLTEGWPGWKQQQAAGQPLEARLARIEEQLALLTPFIGSELRPNISQGALSREEDVALAHKQMLEGSAKAKRTFDTKTREY
jgi:immune inhibitor A